MQELVPFIAISLYKRHGKIFFYQLPPFVCPSPIVPLSRSRRTLIHFRPVIFFVLTEPRFLRKLYRIHYTKLFTFIIGNFTFTLCISLRECHLFGSARVALYVCSPSGAASLNTASSFWSEGGDMETQEKEYEDEEDEEENGDV